MKRLNVWGPKKLMNKPRFSAPNKAFCKMREVNGKIYPDGEDENQYFGGTLWRSCREDYHNDYKNLPNMLFATKSGKNVARFIWRVERKLGLKIRTKAGPTNLPNVAWFHPNSFWRGNVLRRALFTILLRSGVQFDPKNNNFDKALKSDYCSKGTEPALEAFLKGYVSLNPNRYKFMDYYDEACWQDTFGGLKDEDVTKILRKTR